MRTEFQFNLHKLRRIEAGSSSSRSVFVFHSKWENIKVWTRHTTPRMVTSDRGWPEWGHDSQANILPATGHRAHWPVVTVSGNYRNIRRVGLPANPEPVSS